MNHPVKKQGFSPPIFHLMRCRKGMVLVIVLIVVAMVGLASFSFAELMFVEEKAVRLQGDELQLEHAIGSGEELIKSLLEQPKTKIEQLGGIHHNPNLFQAIRLTVEQESRWQARFSIVSPQVEDDRFVGIRFGIENESARLNLKAINSWGKKQPGLGRQALLTLPGMTESIADAILDWMDDDSHIRELGAEEEYYSGLEPPYVPSNRVPNTLEELLLVRGVTRELLWGNDLNYNHLEEEGEKELARTQSNRFNNETPGKTHTEENHLPWASLLTLYSSEQNATPERLPRIYLNLSDLSSLHEQLSEAVDESSADFIVAYRQYGPASTTISRTSFSAPVYQTDFSIPGRFKISSLLDLIDVNVVISKKREDQPEEIILSSPWHNTSPSLREDFSKLQDLASTTETNALSGRININIASKTVLRAIPQIDEKLADEIILARRTQGRETPKSHRYTTWLLAEGLVDLEQMKALAPYLTCGGDVYRGQIISFFENQGPYARAELIVDATSKPPRRVYWKNLKVWGRGYSLEMLGGENQQDLLDINEQPRQNQSRSDLTHR